jgi:AcrR family transcriptional regulator
MTRPPNTELPDTILEVAEQIVAEHGHNALNMRSLADRVRVTPTTLYYYYESKEHILRELKLRAAHNLNATISKVDQSRGPAPALLELGEAYIKFAEDNPNLYKLLVEVRLDPSLATDADYETLCFSYYAARRLLESMVKHGKRKFDPVNLAMVGWVLLHGFSSLLVAGTLESVTKLDRDQLKAAFLEFYRIEAPCEDGSRLKGTSRKSKGGKRK